MCGLEGSLRGWVGTLGLKPGFWKARRRRIGGDNRDRSRGSCGREPRTAPSGDWATIGDGCEPLPPRERETQLRD